MTGRFSLLAAAVLLVWLVSPHLVVSAQQSPPAGPAFRLATIEVSGARRYTQADIARVAGLETGQSVTAAQVGAAVDRLLTSGLFQNVNARYATEDRQMTVTVEVVESLWTVPVVFDNFLAFTDDQLIAALGPEVPSFDGTSPAAPEAIAFIGQALQKVLGQRGVDGRIVFVPSLDLKTKSQTYVLKVEPGPPLCALVVDGPVAKADPEFRDALRATVGKEYSRSYLAGLSQGTVLDMYHRRGYWRATVSPPSVVAVKDACSGAAATLAVNEGPAFAWDGAEWIGNSALSSEELSRLLQIKPGQTANSAQIEDEKRRVDAAYGRRGYLLQTSTFEPRLDDSTRRAVFAFRIDEGPQFRMGTLDFIGISEDDAKTLRGRWRLKAGDVYDVFYPNEFRAREVPPIEKRSTPPRRATSEIRVNRAQNLVDVRFVFK